MGHALESLSLENNVFKTYLFYSCILVVKMLIMPILIGRWRFTKYIFISPEDAAIKKGAKYGVVDPDIERVRRAHLNDMENVYLFFPVALGYVLTDPAPAFAIMLMRAFTLARIAHTFVYAIVVIPQPARFFAFIIAYLITGYMAVVTAVKFAF